LFLKLKKPLAIFDLETTGMSTANDRIVELSILKVQVNGQQEQLTHRINPGIPIPLESSLVHGIYDADIKDKPLFKDVAKSLVTFLEGADLCGYNLLKFDVPVLMEEFIRADVNFSLSNRNIVDAQKIFHMMEPRTLSAAYRFYCNKELIGAHGAAADTLATFEVLDAQVQRYENQSHTDDRGITSTPVANDMAALHKLTLGNNVDLAGRFMYNRQGIEVFNFGKHKDKPVSEVLQKEPNYYDWMMNGDFPMETKNRLTEMRLKFHLQRK
jgi:DNA polymerase-3 subunit epsilon